VNLGLLELRHRVDVLVAEDVGREHEAHVVLVHLVLFLIVDEASHEVDGQHERVAVQWIHSVDQLFQRLLFLILFLAGANF